MFSCGVCIKARDTHSCAVTTAIPHTARDELRHAQQTDSHLAKVIQACTQSLHRPTGSEWRKQPLQHYRQLWSQLRVVDGTLYRHLAPGPTSEPVTVRILPASLYRLHIGVSSPGSILGEHGERCGEALYGVPANQATGTTTCSPYKHSHWQTMANGCRGHS